MLQPALSVILRADIFVDNMPGGGGIVAARFLSSATPDGRTIGVMNGAGMLTARVTGRKNVPSLVTDFEILGKVSPMQHVWAVASESRFYSVDDLRHATARGPLVLGVRNIASTSFASLAIGAHLLGLQHVIISGYASNRETRLAAMRGELDVVSMDVSSGSRLLANGSMRPLLQISEHDFKGSPYLAGVDTLADHVDFSNQSNNPSVSSARVLTTLLQANKLFVAPAGLPPSIGDCLQNAISSALNDEATAATLHARFAGSEFIDGTTTRKELQTIVDSLPVVESIVSTAAKRLR